MEKVEDVRIFLVIGDLKMEKVEDVRIFLVIGDLGEKCDFFGFFLVNGDVEKNVKPLGKWILCLNSSTNHVCRFRISTLAVGASGKWSFLKFFPKS